jgi:hypothetical protein
MLRQVCLQSLVRCGRQRAAMLPMESQPVFCRQFPLARQRVVVINTAQGFLHVTAFLGKAVHHFYNLPSWGHEK